MVWELHHRGEMTQRELSQVLGCTPRNVTGLLDGLEAAGFVARGPHPNDRRATLVGLTARGTGFAAATESEHEAFADYLFDDLPPGEVAGFLSTLAHVIDRLKETRPSPCA